MAPLIPIPKLEVLRWRDAEKEFELANFMSSQWLISEIPTKEEMKNLIQEVQQV